MVDLGYGVTQITLVREDGDILGIYYHDAAPPRGWEWHAANGDWGDASEDAECFTEIMAARERG